MIIVIKLKETDNIIGAKEDIAMWLEGVADILHINVYDDKEINDVGKEDDTKREGI